MKEKLKELVYQWKAVAVFFENRSKNQPVESTGRIAFALQKEMLEVCASQLEEAVNKGDDKTVGSYFNIADNSDAFREWLNDKGICYIANGHYTSIPDTVHVFALGMEWGVYKKENQNK